jgi:hypothetical protein
VTGCGHPGPSTLCDSCGRNLRRRLVDIPELYLRLEVEIVQATPVPSERSSGAPPLIPTDVLDVLLLRAGQIDGLESLEGWCRVVIEDRRFSWPEPADTVYGRLATACGFLWRHSAWVLQQPWADELDNETRILAKALHRAVEPDGRWAKTRIPCPRLMPPVEDDGAPIPCPGTLWVDALDPGDPALVCRRCDDRWESEAWQLLGDRVAAPVRIADVAAILMLDHWTIRKWIERGQVPNHGTPGQPRILLKEVLARLRGQRISA